MQKGNLSFLQKRKARRVAGAIKAGGRLRVSARRPLYVGADRPYDVTWHGFCNRDRCVIFPPPLLVMGRLFFCLLFSVMFL
jgi:hypothetical protein